MGKFLGTIVRFVVSAIVLLMIAYIVPGIKIAGFTGAIIAAIVIALIGYVVERAFGDEISPRQRGVVGFVTSAVVIYIAQFLIPAFLSVSLLGSLLAALIIGIVDVFIPTGFKEKER